MSSEKQPSLAENPILQAVTFYVKNGPFIKSRSEGAQPFRASKVVVEKRERGVRFVVSGRTSFGEVRSTNYNSHGYPYPPAPNWLQIIWVGVRDDIE